MRDERKTKKALIRELEELRGRLAQPSGAGEEHGKLEQELREANMRLSAALTEVRRTHQQVIQHERLVALGQMASGIAHDFNNALMPVLGYSECLLSNSEILDDREKTLDILQNVHSAAKDAAGVVQRLRDFYRPPDQDKYASIDMGSLVETAIILTQPRWKEEMEARGVTINVANEIRETPPVSGNESQIREVLTNMILNSVDAMPEGGAITIRGKTKDGWVFVEVSDTGLGMEADVLAQCLEPFFTTKGSEGTGMGLALAYCIIRRHGGDIEINSAPRQGTTITFRLPIREPAEAEREKETTGTHIPPLSVLVIDDDLWSRNLMERYLAAHKHKIETAATGREGIEKFKNGAFDLVITDRAMPDMNGDQVAAAVKQANPDTLVLMVTGFGEIMKDKGDIPVGVDVVLGKPFTQQELHNAIARVIAESRTK